MLKVKADAGRDVYYIFAKVDTRKMPNGISDAVKQVAEVTHERPDRFDVFDANYKGKNMDGLECYNIGENGNYFAIGRKRK